MTMQMSFFAEPAPVAPVIATTKRHYDAGETSEWYTPASIIEAARSTMGAIDLDPASCELANATVRATTHYNKLADGLSQQWRGRVWLNPPYSDFRGQAALWAKKLLAEYDAGRVEQAILLVNLSTAYQPYVQSVAERGSVCVPNYRIRFLDHTGQEQRSPTQANMLIYVGEQQQRFAEYFEQFGLIFRGCR